MVGFYIFIWLVFGGLSDFIRKVECFLNALSTAVWYLQCLLIITVICIVLWKLGYYLFPCSINSGKFVCLRLIDDGVGFRDRFLDYSVFRGLDLFVLVFDGDVYFLVERDCVEFFRRVFGDVFGVSFVECSPLFGGLGFFLGVFGLMVGV